VFGEDILGDTLDGNLGEHFGGHFGWFVILKFIDKLNYHFKKTKLGEHIKLWCHPQERTGNRLALAECTHKYACMLQAAHTGADEISTHSNS
jgi:hypothetical protein